VGSFIWHGLRFDASLSKVILGIGLAGDRLAHKPADIDQVLTPKDHHSLKFLQFGGIQGFT